MGKWSIINLSGLLSLCSISIAGPICDTGDIVSIEAKKFQYREQQENIKSILNEMTNWEVQPSALSDSILDGESRARKVQIRKGLYGVVKVDEGGLSVGGSASKETLAYRMDRIYGFDLVEPTVRKRLGIGQKQTYASVQLWIEDAVPLTKYKGNRIDLAEERDRLKLFDVMTLHADRIDDRNLMIKKSKLGDKLVAIDHEKAFLDFRTYISEIKEGELESVVHYLSTQRTQNTMLWQNIRDQLEHPQLLCFSLILISQSQMRTN